MNRNLVSVAISSALAVSLVPALAGAQVLPSKEVDVKVLRVVENYSEVTRIVPEEECYRVEVKSGGRSDRSHTPELLGALIGGAIGNEIRDSSTSKIAGALLGASIASDLEKRNKKKRGGSKTEVRCETVHREITSTERDGYKVTFEFDGQAYSAVVNSYPGNTMPVNLYIIPVDIKS